MGENKVNKNSFFSEKFEIDKTKIYVMVLMRNGYVCRDSVSVGLYCQALSLSLRAYPTNSL